MFYWGPKTAAEWIVRLQRGELSARDEVLLRRWLESSPDHLAQLETAHALWMVSQRLNTSPAARTLLYRLKQERSQLFAGTITSRPIRRWVALPATAMVSLALLVGLYVSTSGYPHLDNGRSAETNTNEIGNYTLPDGSTLTLAPDSVARLTFTQSRRQLHLERGELFLRVISNPNRPFVVSAGVQDVVVTGTKFNVDYHNSNKAIEVGVVEGSITVQGQNGTLGDPIIVNIGEVVLVSADQPPLRKRLSAEQAAAWRSRKLYFESASPQEVLDEFNRFAPKRLVFEGEIANNITINGTFEADDVEGIIYVLNRLFGIKARETDDRWILTAPLQRSY